MIALALLGVFALILVCTGVVRLVVLFALGELMAGIDK